MRARGRVVGIDLGSRRIGVAVSDDGQSVAVPVETLFRGMDHAADHRAIGALVTEYEAVGVVVGLPLSLNGQEGPAARAVAEEVGEMRSILGVDVDTVDERMTTVSAAAALRRAGRRSRQQRPVIDQAAAAVLLQSWLDRRAAEAERQ